MTGRCLVASSILISAACATTRSVQQPDTLAARANAPELNVRLVAPHLYDELVIETDVAGKCAPDKEALAELASFAASLLAPVKITVLGTERIPQSEWPEEWNLAEFQKLAAANLRGSAEPRQQPFYILYVDREDDTLGLGGKFVNWIISSGPGTSIVPGMFVVCDAFQGTPLGLVSRASMEAYTLKHEFGHALGLVKNGIHESSDAPGHCSQDRCLMQGFYGYGAIRYLSLGLPWSRLPKALCDDCLADIAAARGRASLRSTEENRSLARLQADLTIFNRFIETGELARAIDLGRTLGSRYPERHDALQAEGIALALLGDRDAALAVLSRSLQQGSDPRARTSTARLLCALGAYEAAAALMSPAIAPNDRSATRVLLWALEGSGRLQEALNILQTYIDSDPPRGEIYQAIANKARLLRISGRPSDALDELDKLPREHKYWHPDSLIELSKVRMEIGDAVASRKALLEAREVVEHQLLRVSDSPHQKWQTAAFRLENLKIAALLGQSVVPDGPLTEVIASLDELPHHQKLQLGLDLAGVLAMFGDFDRAEEWCVKSRGAIAFLFDARRDPGLSDAFRIMRETGRIGRRYPWCSTAPLNSDSA